MHTLHHTIVCACRGLLYGPATPVMFTVPAQASYVALLDSTGFPVHMARDAAALAAAMLGTLPNAMQGASSGEHGLIPELLKAAALCFQMHTAWPALPGMSPKLLTMTAEMPCGSPCTAWLDPQPAASARDLPGACRTRLRCMAC
jgi:hypothetical protein